MFVLQPALLTLDLFNQRAADAADADNKDLNHLIGVEQHLVSYAYSGGRIIIADHHGNRTLGRALGNRHDIDISAGQRGEELRRDPAQRTHTVAHHGDDRQTIHDRQRLQLALFQLQIELIFHHPFCACTVALRYAETDAVFR